MNVARFLAWGRQAVSLLALLAVVSATAGLLAAAEKPTDPATDRAGIEHFEKHIRPVLVEHCYRCHSQGAKGLQGGLALDHRAGVLRGGDSGPVVVAGKPGESLLMQALRHEGGMNMPPDKRLPDEVIAHFAQWIERGLPDPRTRPTPLTATAEHPAVDPARLWAFQPLGDVSLPAPQQAAECRQPLDRFIAARQEASGLRFAALAPARTWQRRVTYDLTGLPVNYDDAQTFAADHSAEAYERLIDRLLASPHFGERWGRHWLDLARYADTKGYVFTEDRNYAEAHRFRDWVVQSLNSDLPYDEFIRRQLAADRLPPERQSWEAMGFLTLGRRFLNNSFDIIDDRIDLVTRGLLGLTVGCARCHDHKYDPISMQDYYALFGVFASSQEPGGEPSALRLVDVAQPGDHPVLLRGRPGNHGPIAPRQYLKALSPQGPRPLATGSGRLDLAEAIVARENPLAARVFVNRVWAQLFGRGLVLTPSDLGVRSDPPSHPELLDYLAAEFMRDWSIKRLIRSIVLSRTYAQASVGDNQGEAVDPENRLLWRMNRRRADFEAMRDAILVASGQWEQAIGGPSVEITQAPYGRRRTLYAFIDRQNLPGLFRTFDFASPDTHSPQRFQTTVPQQALYLFNGPFVMERAIDLAQRTRDLAGDDERARIEAMFQAALARDPTPNEVSWVRDYLAAERKLASEPAWSGWAFGYGFVDEKSERTSFQRLPHAVGERWQGGAQLPDAKLGWVFLDPRGGHPGNDQRHAAIRRWGAPEAGTVAVSGQLRHPAAEGDGVRARVVSSQRGIIGAWSAHHGESATPVAAFAVQEGETLDFVVDCRTGPAHDSFQWEVALEFQGANGAQRRFESTAGFRTGAEEAGLDPWQRLAQVLLWSNEFHFVD